MAIVANISALQSKKIMSLFPLSLKKYLSELEQKNSKVRQEFEGLSAGQKNERLLEEGIKAIEQCYLTTTRDHAIIESHQKFIDFQLLIEGEEYMETALNSKLSVKESYHAEKDLIIYNESQNLHLLKMATGDYAIFMPEDAHRSTLQMTAPALVRKVVIKIPSHLF